MIKSLYMDENVYSYHRLELLIVNSIVLMASLVPFITGPCGCGSIVMGGVEEGLVW